MTPTDLKQLLKSNQLKTLDAEAYGNLQALLHDPFRQDELERLLAESMQQTQPVEAVATQEYLYQILKERFGIGNEEQAPVKRIPFFKTIWLRYAATILFALSFGAYYWTTSIKKNASTSVATTTDIVPGKDGAILTLADGSQLALDSLSDGLVAAQNGSKVLLQNGQLSYQLSGDPTDAVVNNTMSTPVGRQFQMILPDGTRVWLNAASSISYPTVFTGKERKVFITGEVYFEVAQNAKQPFRVNINNKAAIDVLGTSFNINAYENEQLLNTTLLEGSIKVNGSIIQPGEQAQLSVSNLPHNAAHPPLDQMRVVRVSDINKVMAWKNGLFNFEGATLKEIMKQLERWYNIEVAYEKRIPDIELTGKMSRDVTLNDLMILLEKLGVHTRLEDRKLIVLPR